ncbi:MAG TPA: tRNA (adenosine(37)-N6)-threonylcarbamoyltransferase complex ATPase subunit type 1 TsaE [Acidimicrobiales bacterium]|nr:tRNA (adenosine(37)-N6)-threonylcarbamoyltransferase complex ATPase subunit type 1 TsaE [Acidimicrobiales bacterium]
MGPHARLTLRCRDAAETAAFGGLLALVVEVGDVVLLSGELGAGKTTLVSGLVAALGGGAATSPTFTLCHRYDTAPVVWHADCWRLADAAEAADLALDEALEEGVVVVEWGELVAPVLGASALRVDLAPVPGAPGERVVDCRGPAAWEARLERLRARCLERGLAIQAARAAP